MRERYVLQVLLATLGCGVLLAVIGVVDAPNDAWQPMVGAPYAVPPSSNQLPTKDVKGDKRSPGLADFGDECDLLFRNLTETETSPKQECDTSSSPHKQTNRGNHHGAKAGAADDC
jgi:hypothetical protein